MFRCVLICSVMTECVNNPSQENMMDWNNQQKTRSLLSIRKWNFTKLVCVIALRAVLLHWKDFAGQKRCIKLNSLPVRQLLQPFSVNYLVRIFTSLLYLKTCPVEIVRSNEKRKRHCLVQIARAVSITVSFIVILAMCFSSSTFPRPDLLIEKRSR